MHLHRIQRMEKSYAFSQQIEVDTTVLFQWWPMLQHTMPAKALTRKFC